MFKTPESDRDWTPEEVVLACRQSVTTYLGTSDQTLQYRLMSFLRRNGKTKDEAAKSAFYDELEGIARLKGHNDPPTKALSLVIAFFRMGHRFRPPRSQRHRID